LRWNQCYDRSRIGAQAPKQNAARFLTVLAQPL
jgi:hypothetical protein